MKKHTIVNNDSRKTPTTELEYIVVDGHLYVKTQMAKCSHRWIPCEEPANSKEYAEQVYNKDVWYHPAHYQIKYVSSQHHSGWYRLKTGETPVDPITGGLSFSSAIVYFEGELYISKANTKPCNLPGHENAKTVNANKISYRS